jgi:hypothetical protein
MLRDLYRELTGNSRRAENKQILSGQESGAFGECGPGGHTGICDCCYSGGVEAVAAPQCTLCARLRYVRRTCQRGSGDAEIDSRTILLPCHAIHTGDKGQCCRAAVMGSGRQGFHNGVQSCGNNVEKDFALRRDWLGESCIPGRRIERMDDSSIHRELALDHYRS